MKFNNIEGAEPSPIGLNASNLLQKVNWMASGCVTHVKDQVLPLFNDCDFTLSILLPLYTTLETVWVILGISYYWSS